MQFNILSRSLSRDEPQSKLIADQIIYHPEPQSEIEVLYNVYYFPDSHRLYHESGEQIELSLRWDGDRNPIPWPPNTPEKREISDTIPIFEHPVVFLGVLFPHYGHFITECTARIWAARAVDDPSVKFFFTESHPGTFWREGYIAEYFHLLSFPLEKFVFFDAPIKFRRVYLPRPSFILPKEAYSNHVNLPRLASQRVLAQKPTLLSDRPVYLSRARYQATEMTNDRTLRNEIQFEEKLKAEGVLIFDSHKLNIHQKLRLFNSHRYIIGTRGAHFFTMLFCLNGKEQEICMLYESGRADFLRDFCLAEVLSGVTGNYLGVMTSHVGNILEQKPGRMGLNDWEIDIPQTLSWLSQRGILKSRAVHVPRRDSQIALQQDGTLAGSLSAYFAGRWPNVNEHGLAGGHRYNGRHLQAISAVVHDLPNDQFEYQVLNELGIPSDWVSAGTYCGTRGKPAPLLGFAARLKGEATARFEICYVATFVDVEAPVWAKEGEICRANPDAPLEALQIFIRPRDAKVDEHRPADVSTEGS